MDLVDGNESMNDVHYRLLARGWSHLNMLLINGYYDRVAFQIVQVHKYRIHKGDSIKYSDITLDMYHWIIHYDDGVSIRPALGRLQMVNEGLKIAITEDATVRIIRSLPMPIADEIMQEYVGAMAYCLLAGCRSQ